MNLLVLNIFTTSSVLAFLPSLIKDIDDPIGVPEVKAAAPRAEYDFIVVGGGSAGRAWQ